jgi:hypothetical protein
VVIAMTEVTDSIRRFAKFIVNFDEDERAEQIAQYIEAERQRCFQITEDQYDEAPSVPFDNGGTSDGWRMACTRIGKLILLSA